jgi:hypothetical protein
MIFFMMNNVKTFGEGRKGQKVTKKLGSTLKKFKDFLVTIFPNNKTLN